MNLDALLAAAVQAGASDIHLKLGRPPLVRLDGAVTPLAGPELTEEDLDSCLRALTAVGDEATVREGVERYRAAGATSPCVGPIPKTDFQATLRAAAPSR